MEGILITSDTGEQFMLAKRMESARYRATRRQIAKAFLPPNQKYKSAFRQRWHKVRFKYLTEGSTYPDHAYARAFKTKVYIGCQSFKGKDARILREWATA